MTIVFIRQVELVQTLEECEMSQYIPHSTSDGLKEILLGCLNHTQRKIFASILFYYATCILKHLICVSYRIMNRETNARFCLNHISMVPMA
jgi:hypothetical protein